MKVQRECASEGGNGATAASDAAEPQARTTAGESHVWSDGVDQRYGCGKPGNCHPVTRQIAPTMTMFSVCTLSEHVGQWMSSAARSSRRWGITDRE